MKAKLLLGLALVLSGFCHAAIIYPQAPEGGRQLANQFIHAFSLKFMGITNLEGITIAAPHQSFSVGLTNLAAGRLLADAATGYGGGWQYLLMRGTNAVGLIWLKADSQTGKALKCTQIGPCGKGMTKALRVAEQLPQVRKQDYELRSLNMPWLQFHALWLHGQSNDIVIPLPDTWGRWKADQPCSESEIINVLKPIAQEKLKQPPGLSD